MFNDTIQEAGRQQAKNIIMGRTPVGLFWFREFNGIYIGINNTQGGDALTKEFNTKEECLKWLKGEK